jgi:hypothetical protein
MYPLFKQFKGFLLDSGAFTFMTSMKGQPWAQIYYHKSFNPDMTPYDIASFDVKKYKADTTPYDVKSYRIASINV